MRGLRVLPALLAFVALSTSSPSAAAASTPEPTDLADRGWTCFVPPTVPEWVVCFNPGTGRPFPGNPDPAPSYTFKAFSGASGEFLFTGHLVRSDLYRGQPCAPGSEPYVFRPPIGYYECAHT